MDPWSAQVPRWAPTLAAMAALSPHATMASMQRSLPGELGLSSIHLIDSQPGSGYPRLGP
jgi:hypothetical protein